MSKHDKDKDSKRVKQSQRDARAGDPAPAEGGGHGHQAAKAHGRPATVDATLPSSRGELIELHAAARRRRNAAAYDSPDHRAAIDDIGRIEIRIADVERSMTPPRG
jgi:hypothetical protein